MRRKPRVQRAPTSRRFRERLFVLVAAVVVACLSSAGVAETDRGTDITEPGRVAALSELQDSIDAVSGVVSGCMQSGGAHHDCLCAAREQLRRFKTTLERISAEHPALSGLDLVRFRNAEGMSVAQSLVAIRRQAEAMPVCTGPAEAEPR